jgi:hypothetical protein
MEAETTTSDGLKARQDVSDPHDNAPQNASDRAAAPKDPSVQRNGRSSSPAAEGAAPATLHAADMLIMAKEFVRIFREHHPDRRPPSLLIHTDGGQQVLLTQLLRSTQVWAPVDQHVTTV